MQLVQVAVFLAAAVIAAPLGRFLRMGAVLGYLAAGVLIGPYILGPLYELNDVEGILQFGEFGVVMLLFIIGLELRPVRLLALRSAIFGLGTKELEELFARDLQELQLPGEETALIGAERRDGRRLAGSPRKDG